MSIYDTKFKVRLTKTDCKRGKRRDCFRCPVALALQRATGDGEANVFEMCYQLHLEAWGRLVVAPPEVVEFVWNKDADRNPEPMAFTLPPINEWQEKCYHCEDIFEQSELDDDGVCEGCRIK